MTYAPFLKLKRNEILCLCQLDSSITDHYVPFFDVPRVSEMKEADFIQRVVLAQKDLKRSWDTSKRFYLDTFDIDPDLRPNDLCPYGYLMTALKEFIPIPVIGLDRDDDHLNFVAGYLDEMEVKEVAVRFQKDDFEDFELVEEEIEEMLGTLLEKCEHIDLVLDCRVLTDKTVRSAAQTAANFANSFCQKYTCRKVIVAGSSIPSDLSKIVTTNNEAMIDRLEPQLWALFQENYNGHAKLVFSDYGIVSPEYSDIDFGPALLGTIAAPKAVYSTQDNYFIIRGGKFRTHKDGYGQYYTIAAKIASKDFFRGPSFSSGDAYIHQKSKRIPTPGSPQTWIKNTLDAHISYMIATLT